MRGNQIANTTLRKYSIGYARPQITTALASVDWNEKKLKHGIALNASRAPVCFRFAEITNDAKAEEMSASVVNKIIAESKSKTFAHTQEPELTLTDGHTIRISFIYHYLLLTTQRFIQKFNAIRSKFSCKKNK